MNTVCVQIGFRCIIISNHLSKRLVMLLVLVQVHWTLRFVAHALYVSKATILLLSRLLFRSSMYQVSTMVNEIFGCPLSNRPHEVHILCVWSKVSIWIVTACWILFISDSAHNRRFSINYQRLLAVAVCEQRFIIHEVTVQFNDCVERWKRISIRWNLLTILSELGAILEEESHRHQ